MVTRNEVYVAIDSERSYQDRKWGYPSEHEMASWLTYMRDYLDEATHLVSRNSDADVRAQAMTIVRKVTALGVACMEEHGAPMREMP